MNLIESTAEIIKEENPFKQIERIGRTCYKSEDKITETSCYKFVQGMIDRQHFAMLEHGRILFRVECRATVEEMSEILACPDADIWFDPSLPGAYKATIAVSLSHLYNPRYSGIEKMSMMRELFRMHISKRYNIPLELIPSVSKDYWRQDQDHESEQIYYMLGVSYFSIVNNESEIVGIKSISVKFTCDRGVSHELVRHRVSAAQESTRYCNYSKEKFGGGVTFVFPSSYDEWGDGEKDIFIKSCEQSEENYLNLIDAGRTPQEARAVLTNALKTECILTMKVYQWVHFFDMRFRGVTGAPHPDMVKVASIAHERIKEAFRLDL